MKNKGFTLIEVIAAVVILSIISLIVIPIVNKNIKESREKLYTRQVETIVSAAKRWAITNADVLTEDILPFELTLTTLKADGYLEKGDIKNPKDETIMNGCVLIDYDSNYNQNVFSYKDTCGEVSNP